MSSSLGRPHFSSDVTAFRGLLFVSLAPILATSLAIPWSSKAQSCTRYAFASGLRHSKRSLFVFLPLPIFAAWQSHLDANLLFILCCFAIPTITTTLHIPTIPISNANLFVHFAGHLASRAIPRIPATLHIPTIPISMLTCYSARRIRRS
jgi:hypothetical protein